LWARLLGLVLLLYTFINLGYLLATSASSSTSSRKEPATIELRELTEPSLETTRAVHGASGHMLFFAFMSFVFFAFVAPTPKSDGTPTT